MAIHIFNEIAQFIDFHTAPDGDFLWAGDSRVPISVMEMSTYRSKDRRGSCKSYACMMQLTARILLPI